MMDGTETGKSGLISDRLSMVTVRAEPHKRICNRLKRVELSGIRSAKKLGSRGMENLVTEVTGSGGTLPVLLVHFYFGVNRSFKVIAINGGDPCIY